MKNIEIYNDTAELIEEISCNTDMNYAEIIEAAIDLLMEDLINNRQ